MNLLSRAPLLRGLLLSIVFLLFIPANTQAQEPSKNPPVKSGFVEADVITSAGDTLHGSVKKWALGGTPQKIRFQENPASEVVAYHPPDLRGVRAKSGKRLVSRIVLLDQVPVNPKAASEFLREREDTMKTDATFLEVIVDGPLKLYVRLGKRDRYFIEGTDDEQPVELIKRKRLVNVRGKKVISTTDRYRRQIARRTMDCSRLAGNASEVDLDLQSLRNHVASYNRCVADNEENLFVRETADQVEFSFGVVAELGRRHHTGSIEILPSLLVVREDLKWTTGYSAGISMNLDWASFHQLEAYGEIQVAQQKVKIPESVIEQLFLQLEVGGRYYFTDGYIRPYLEIGGRIARDINTRNADSFPRGPSTGADQLKKTEAGALVGGGVMVNRIRVGIRGRVSSGIFENPVVGGTLHLGYQL